MPYTVDSPNLPKNVKALPENDRAQWVEVWNASFSACMKDGGDSGDCEGEAFRKANGVAMADEQQDNIAANVVDKVHRQSWEGRDWLVVPTIMIKEGVLNGEYVSADELRKFPAAWNGRPFVIEHPKEGETAVSANDPKVIEKFRAGYIFGTEYRESDKSVPAEIWLDIERTKKMKGGPSLMQRILKGDPIEVSTGYFRDKEERSGSWDGRAYNGVARNLRPDHLAALLESTGACSWEDGCGCPRVNEDGGEQGGRMLWTQPTELVYQVDTEDETDMDGNEPKRNIVRDALHTLASAFGINGSDITQEEDVETMAKSKADLVKDLCTRLELNAEDDSAGFEALSADVLRKILNAFGQPDEEPEEKKPPEEDEPMPNDVEDEEETPQEPQANEQPCADARFNSVDAELKALKRMNVELAKRLEAAEPVVRLHQEAQASEKANLVGELTANERCAFNKDELAEMDIPQLQKLARSLKPANYQGQAGTPAINKQETRRLVPFKTVAGKEK